MITGRIDYQCPLPATMIPLIQANRVKGIATLGKQRLASLPNLPTAHEEGLTDFDGSVWWGFFFPKGTPDAIVRKLNQAAAATLDTPSVQERLCSARGQHSSRLNADRPNICKIPASEIERWAVPIKATGASVD
jgi:tripartite-type tricarboxylate transporter receptor subunit TctC